MKNVLPNLHTAPFDSMVFLHLFLRFSSVEFRRLSSFDTAKRMENSKQCYLILELYPQELLRGQITQRLNYPHHRKSSVC